MANLTRPIPLGTLPLWLALLPMPIFAQDATTPRLTMVFPPGVKAGGRETWTILGRNLGRVETIDVEGGGVEVVVTDASPRRIVAEARADPGAVPGFRAVRAWGPDGVSNLRVVRVDVLEQTPEREPNDTASSATPLPRGRAGVGVLGPQDLDHFRVDARGGERVTIEVEARRLGVPVAPVLTVLRPDGRALFQGRETPGVEGDCRFAYTFPADGPYLIQVRDNLYAGAEGACYRLRVTAEPFATGLFPLGGPPGRSVSLTATGGTLPAPLVQNVSSPDTPGAVVDLPPFVGPRGPVLAPGRFQTGDGPETSELAPRDGAPNVPPLLTSGSTVNGRIGRPGEVDRYRVRVSKGESVRFAIAAAPLGSWLDSVLTVRDARNKVLAENDDAAFPLREGTATAGAAPDSRIDFRPDVEDDLFVEVADRFGQGGPEYAYRLTAGPIVPDFSVLLRLNTSGGFALKPGDALTIPFSIVREGRTGPITVRAESLAEGVTSDPVVIRSPVRSPASTAPPLGPIGVMSGSLVLRIAPGARPLASRFRVVGVCRREDGRVLTRDAFAPWRDDSVPIPGPSRPIDRRLTSFPLVILRQGWE